MIATSTLFSYDIYRHYFRPKATSTELVTASRVFIVFWAIFSGALASIFHAVGIVGHLSSSQATKLIVIPVPWLAVLLPGCIHSVGCLPYRSDIPVRTPYSAHYASLTYYNFSWKDLSTAGAVAGSIGGMAIALVVWLATAKGIGGEITVDTLSDQWVSFAGNAAAIISGGILSIGLSLWRPANFDWEKTRRMEVIGGDGNFGEDASSVGETDEKEKPRADEPAEVGAERNVDGLDLRALQHTYKVYGLIFIVLTLVITFVSSPLLSADSVLIPNITDHPCSAWSLAVHLFA